MQHQFSRITRQAQLALLIASIVLMYAMAELSVPGLVSESDYLKTSQLDHSEQFSLKRIGLYTPLPIAFEFTLSESTSSPEQQLPSPRRFIYHYQHNGITIKVQFVDYASGNVQELSEIRESVTAQLKNLMGLELIDIAVAQVSRQNHKGVVYRAKYLMQPLAKEINYHINNYVSGTRMWTVIATYKSCDNRGKALVNEFVDTLNFI